MNQADTSYVIESLEDATIPAGGRKDVKTRVSNPTSHSLVRVLISKKNDVVPIDIMVTVFNYGQSPIKVSVGMDIAKLTIMASHKIEEIENFSIQGFDDRCGQSFCDAKNWELSRIDLVREENDKVTKSKRQRPGDDDNDVPEVFKRLDSKDCMD